MTYAKLPYQTLPSSAQLKSGAWVSNYHLLPDTILKAEGWLPLDEVKPVLTEGQYHELDTAVEVDGRIVATYKVITPEPEIDPEPILTALEELT